MLPFLDRVREREKIQLELDKKRGSLIVLYGRRRLGKSRLIREVIADRVAIYYVGDDRDAALQRAALATEIARLVPGFADVRYDEWDALLARWWRDAPAGAVLVLDELPSMVAASSELPSLLQKYVDREDTSRKLIVSGSSQRMMHGLVLDGSAPLYGRARVLLGVEPLPAGWLREAFGDSNAATMVDRFAVWGGVPRYWELARDYDDLWASVDELVLDPMGVLHREPERLLLDELQDTVRAASILALVGSGCHRISEVAGRLGVPATSLARPMERLLGLGLLARDMPFGRSARDSKRSHYRLAEPFLAFWYRFVEPNRSRLALRQIQEVRAEVERAWPQFMGGVWERLAASSVAHLEIEGHRFKPAARWWGPSLDGHPLELDLVAEAADDPNVVLVGEAKIRLTAREARSARAELERKAATCPPLASRQVVTRVWTIRPVRGAAEGVITARDVMGALR